MKKRKFLEFDESLNMEEIIANLTYEEYKALMDARFGEAKESTEYGNEDNQTISNKEEGK